MGPGAETAGHNAEEQFAKIDAIRAETNRKFAAILNQEQKKKFDAFLKESEPMGMRPPRGP